MPAKNKIPRKTQQLHELFVKEYIACNANATAAYLKVYPNSKKRSASVLACRLLDKVNIRELLKKEYKKILKDKDSEIEQSKTYKLIHAIGNSKISDVINLENGTLEVKDISEIPIEAQEAIESIQHKTKEGKYGIESVLVVKMHDRIKALELRAKMQGLLEKDIGSLEIIIKPAKVPNEILDEEKDNAG